MATFLFLFLPGTHLADDKNNSNSNNKVNQRTQRAATAQSASLLTAVAQARLDKDSAMRRLGREGRRKEMAHREKFVRKMNEEFGFIKYDFKLYYNSIYFGCFLILFFDLKEQLTHF